jgi:pimeloyl-ACP methyl ester carboxylesterase
MKEGPTFFGPKERRLFGWLHAPTTGAPPEERPRVGVVLCNPFGYEALCTHRSLRHFARAFARAGLPALRFDYDGTGDSAGSDRDPDRVRAWIDSIHEAIEFLKSESGVASVCCFGLRLGATLAAAAAADRTDCAGLIAVAPVVSPALYLRELAALHAWIGLAPPPDGRSGVAEGDQEAAGFVITAATAEALRRLDLMTLERAPAPRVLVIERADRPTQEAWPARLTALGVDVETRRLPGFSEMNWDPHKALVPTQMIDACEEWSGKSLPRFLEHVAEASPSHRSVEAPSRDSAVGGGVVETAVSVDGSHELFGLVAHPAEGQRRREGRRAVILLNAGAQQRIGPNRLWVTLSRRWAERGVVVLRLDVSALGDSAPRPGYEENSVYTPAGIADVGEAAAYLRRTWGASQCDVVGFCGTAYHAFHAAAQGLGVDGALLINQQVFFWDPNRPVEVVGSTRAISEISRYRSAASSAASWKKLLTGKVKLRAAGRVLRKRTLDLAVSRGREVARFLRVPLEHDLVTELRRATKNGVVLRFLFAAGEGGEQLLRELGGALVTDLEVRGALVIDRIRQTDHTFTAVWAQRVLGERLEASLGLPREPDHPPSDGPERPTMAANSSSLPQPHCQ